MFARMSNMNSLMSKLFFQQSIEDFNWMVDANAGAIEDLCATGSTGGSDKRQFR